MFFKALRSGLHSWKFEILGAAVVTSVITPMELRDHLTLMGLEVRPRIFHEIAVHWPRQCRNTVNLKLIKGKWQLKILKCIAYQLKVIEGSNYAIELE